MSEQVEHIIRAKTDDYKEPEDLFSAQDPFNKTWDELKQLQRKIRADRQKQIYDAAERRQSFINTVMLFLLLGAMICTVRTISSTS